MTPQQLKAMKLALEALEYLGTMHFQHTGEALYQETFTAIEEALAEHAMSEVQRLGQEIEQEPVGKIGWAANRPNTICEVHWIDMPPVGTKLYTAPPQRKPLTHDELSDIWYKQSTDWMEFARVIEAAHGIKENT